MHTHPYEHMHANPTPMHAFERLGRLDLEIDEITTDVSLSSLVFLITSKPLNKGMVVTLT